MGSPDVGADDRWTQTGVSEFVKVILLTLGTILLSALVATLVIWAQVPSHAAWGYAYLAAGSILLALVLVAPWTFLFQEFMARLGNDQPDARKQPTSLRRATRIRIDRGALGLWAPFAVNLIGVGWLIYYSGGIVHSPFAAVPVIMFTLVVLLIDPPVSPSVTDETKVGQGVARPPVWPFVVLGAIALAFFVCLVILNVFSPADLETEPTDGAGIAVNLSTAAVGIVLAAVARWGLLQKVVEAREAGQEEDG
jgi:hypothetical protein